MARPMRGEDTVRVEGLSELRRELRRLDDPTIQQELKDVNFAVAESLVGPAQSLAGSLGRMEAKAAQTLRPGRGAASATLSFGGSRAPFAAGAEFGALRWKQFKPWRGSGATAGYWLWPTIRAEGDRIVDMYGDAIEQITSRAFPD